MKINAGKVLIVGCGSIGKAHLNYVSNFAERIIIVDPIFPEQEIGKGFEFSKIEWYASIEQLSSLDFDDTDIGVVANWGPDHFRTFENVVALGITRIVLEKPMVTSISELEAIFEIVQKKKLHIVVNQGWHYIQLAERINNLSSAKELGPIVMINANGGARCISTAGSHVIHLAHQLLGKDFEKISGNFGDNRINPRNAELSYLDGTLNMTFSGGRYLNISYTNLSSIEGRIEIYWRDAFGILDGDKLEITSRDPLRQFASTVTRYGRPDVDVFNGVLPLGEDETSSQLEGLYKAVVLEKFENLWNTFALHCNSNRTLLLSLISNHRRESLEFNSPLSIDEIAMKFRIS